MARKGSQPRNDLDRKTLKRQNIVPGSLDTSSIENNEKTEEDDQKFADCDRSNDNFLFRSSNPFAEQIRDDDGAGTARSCKQRTSEVPLREKSGDRIQRSRKANRPYKAAGTLGNDLLSDASKSIGTDGVMLHGTCNLSNKYSGISSVGSAAAKVAYLDAMTGWSFRSASYALKTAGGWIEHQKPRFSLFISYMHSTYDHVISNIKYVYPVMRTWILHFGKFIFLLSAIWLDCNIRGLNSLLHLGTTSFFTVLWCSLLSIIGMVGLFKVLIMMVAAIVVLIFIGITPAFLVLAIFTTVVLWLYGSFWMTSLVTFLGGVTFGLHHERVAVFVTMLYSMHCARSYMGWLGLFLGFNLSFISSDIFIQVLKRNVNEHRFGIPPEKNTHSEAGADHGFHSHFQHTDDVFNSSSRGSTDSSREIPSTSGRETELTSEVEVARLLNCSDHYSVLGFNCYENIDVSVLKKEYRKRAMLVHPDKNMGNEKAADAFKKLQNAYEVLLDSIKRKNYDDDLRREELLKFVRRFQTSTQKNERHGIFSSESPYFEAEDRGPHGESRRIFCNKCSTFHTWTPIERSKSQARWCQDCKDFHQAKDGDGWLEQSLHPFLFGLLQKVDTPRAYVCAESKIYDATRWFICQGMRCPTNTHKPSFHVNTSLSSKHNANSKASSSSHRGGGGMPSANMGDAMTQEDFFEWLQNAVSSGMFEPEDPHKEGPSGSGSAGSRSGGRKKRKGKKQR